MLFRSKKKEIVKAEKEAMRSGQNFRVKELMLELNNLMDKEEGCGCKDLKFNGPNLLTRIQSISMHEQLKGINVTLSML